MVNWISSEAFRRLVITRNGKYIAPLRRFAVTNFSPRCVTGTPPFKGKYSKATSRDPPRAPVWGFCPSAGKAAHRGVGSACLCVTHWVTHSKRALGHLGFLSTLWFSKWGGVGGRHLLSDEREGARWTYFISGQNKQKQTNEKTELDYTVRMSSSLATLRFNPRLMVNT